MRTVPGAPARFIPEAWPPLPADTTLSAQIRKRVKKGVPHFRFKSLFKRDGTFGIEDGTGPLPAHSPAGGPLTRSLDPGGPLPSGPNMSPQSLRDAGPEITQELGFPCNSRKRDVLPGTGCRIVTTTNHPGASVTFGNITSTTRLPLEGASPVNCITVGLGVG